MSENLSGQSSGEDLASAPPRQQRAAPPPAKPAPQSSPAPAQPAAAKPQADKPVTGDDMKLKKSVKVNKPIKFKDGKKNT